ncbi:hypothetical protein MTR67_027493 [Solanum verrucosum]|uniref:Uncharacterized protein n=1 Tax=Solanum verrucosum TaxID=315347 RepID=A0AAF0R3R6_SOLVR|nr:hypothetical protein MTR67_027493 [Solanum verrucosum]
MDAIAAAEERIVSERLRQKLNEVNTAAQTQFAGIQDHVAFTLQQAYYRCAYECFDRRRNQEEIGRCVEHCSVPVHNAQNLFQNEMAKFQVTHDVKDRLWPVRTVFWDVTREVLGVSTGRFGGHQGDWWWDGEVQVKVEEKKVAYVKFVESNDEEERLNRSLMVCQDKFESAKLQKNKSNATMELESCVDQSVHDSINVLPHLVDKLKASLGINN